jgi:hypothetical protein
LFGKKKKKKKKKRNLPVLFTVGSMIFACCGSRPRAPMPSMPYD